MKSELIFEFSDPLAASEATTALKIKFDLRFEINYRLIHVHIVSLVVTPYLAAFEATTMSKQPWRSNLTPDLKSVTSITYLSCAYCL